MLMIFWSDDPAAYEHMIGEKAGVGNLIAKKNVSQDHFDLIKETYQLDEIANSIFGNKGDKNYLCATFDNSANIDAIAKVFKNTIVPTFLDGSLCE